MAYSSIVKKKCKSECGRYPAIGYAGFCYRCCPQEIKDKVGSKQKVAARNKANKNLQSRKLHEVQNVVSGAELNRWFDDRHKEMTGICSNCGGKSCKDSLTYWKFSIAHILPKAYFPSVKTHEYNWIELCHFGNSCHTNLDNKMLDLIDMNCFSEIVTKFCIVYPCIAPTERKRIPNVLLQYIETEK